jgi:hypothetical protein
MPDALWSVRLVNGERDRRISLEHRGVWPGLRRTEWRLGEGDEPDTTTFEFEAPDARTARVVAQREMGEMRRRAGVHDAPEGVIWVVRLADEPESSLRFREYASEAIEADNFDLAVATIQIHLKVHVRVLVEMVAEASPSPLLDAVIRRQQRWAPHERWLQPILEALFAAQMGDCPVWEAYVKEHIPRRNAVSHGSADRR